MGYYAWSDLGAGSAAERHAAYNRLTGGIGNLNNNTRFFQDSHIGQYYEDPIDASSGTISINNNTNGNQSKLIDKDPANRLEDGHQDTFAPLHQATFFRPTSVPQLSNPMAYAHNAAAPYTNLYIENARRLYNIVSLGAPVESATRRQIQKLVTGVSVNYLGDPYLAANQSANIPDELNTSVWITNLPPIVNHWLLLKSIRNCGKVYATVINGPENRHVTAASKVVFFDVAGAQNLLRQAREGTFVVNGFIPRVVPNRIKSEAKPPSPNSRVLHIEGPNCIVNQPYLTALFHSDRITWQDEEVIVLSNNGRLTRLEWRFGSYRCQAESARYLIDRVKRHSDLLPLNEAQTWQCVTVHFGVDPCAPKPGKYPLPG
ncbi:hypothetical protein F4859DRAFT_510092 [Xylaria cf. heliscus]|nr:hypothetical protein F4859DRAFT_510092 [Xylaria cf. heliscus]